MVAQKNFTLFITLIILSFFLYLADRSGILQGTRSLIVGLFIPIERSIHHNISSNPFFSNQQIKNLQEENRNLKNQLSLLTQLEKENESLRQQLSIPKASLQKLLAASVLSTGHYFIIDKGSDDGVKEGMSVVYKNIYIGKIFRVQPRVSRVLLPIETESVLAATTVNRSAKGLLRGTGSSMVISEVLLSEKIDQNDTVVTTGAVDAQGLGIRSNLEIGKIFEVKKSDNKLFQEASVVQSVTYKDLTTVFIVF